jgi:hypothetical protein
VEIMDEEGVEKCPAVGRKQQKGNLLAEPTHVTTLPLARRKDKQFS